MRRLKRRPWLADILAIPVAKKYDGTMKLALNSYLVMGHESILAGVNNILFPASPVHSEKTIG
jgi:hypothetical protein